MKKYIPNTITSLNLICGVAGIIQAFQGDLKTAVAFIWLAGVFDFFDGFAARMLKVSSEIGKQLDSLADMVTFGVLPSIVMYQLLIQYTDNSYVPYLAILLAVFSAIRLAKFNIDERQTSGFIGLPTPATALFISSLPFILELEKMKDFNAYVFVALLVITILLSLIMVAEVPLLALKFKDFSWKNNKYRFVFLVISLLLVVTLQIIAIPLIIFVYFIVSILNNKQSKSVETSGND